jgi:hypothetical protein
MDVLMSENDALDAAGSARDRIGQAARRHEVEHAVADGQPAAVEQVIPRRVERLLGAVERLRIGRLISLVRQLPALLEVPAKSLESGRRNAKDAILTARSNRGPWRVTLTKALCWALPGAFFDSLGLPYLERP